MLNISSSTWRRRSNVSASNVHADLDNDISCQKNRDQTVRRGKLFFWARKREESRLWLIFLVGALFGGSSWWFRRGETVVFGKNHGLTSGDNSFGRVISSSKLDLRDSILDVGKTRRWRRGLVVGWHRRCWVDQQQDFGYWQCIMGDFSIVEREALGHIVAPAKKRSGTSYITVYFIENLLWNRKKRNSKNNRQNVTSWIEFLVSSRTTYVHSTCKRTCPHVVCHTATWDVSSRYVPGTRTGTYCVLTNQ